MAYDDEIGEGFIESSAGVRIFHRWRAPAAPRGVLLIVHGFNSHSAYYAWAMERFAQAGLAVYALDLRGRGRSDGERFYIEHFADYLTDVDALSDLARGRHPGLPVFVLGHSAGGVVATSYALDHQKALAGLICESFAYKVYAPDLVLDIMKGASRLVPHVHVFKLNNADFSRDPAAVRAMDEDPLIENETQPIQTVAEMARADERLTVRFPELTLPVLILHGTADKATKPEGSEAFYARASSADKTLKLYDGHAHDLLLDLGKAEVVADMIDWLAARLPEAPDARP